MDSNILSGIYFIILACAIWWAVTNYEIIKQDEVPLLQKTVIADRFKIQNIDYVGTILLDTSTGQTWQYRTLVGKNGKELKDANGRYWEKMAFFGDDKHEERNWVSDQFKIQEYVDNNSE